MNEHRTEWENGLSSEITFWDEWLASKGGCFGAAYLTLFDTSRTLGPQYVRYLPPGDSAVRLLDVGSGPVSPFAVSLPGRVLESIAVDPLAPAYNRALDRLGVIPPIRTEWAEAEKLSSRFPEDSFDLVHASNCIDHCYSPLDAVAEMLAVAKPKCVVMLEHASNEGEWEEYEGLHQWNFDVQEGRFVIWSKREKFDVAQYFGDKVQVEATLHAGERPWVSVALRKQVSGSVRPPPPPPPEPEPIPEPPKPTRYALVDQVFESLGTLRESGMYRLTRSVARRFLGNP